MQLLEKESFLVAETPDPERILIFEPTLVKLPSGELICSYEHKSIEYDQGTTIGRLRFRKSTDQGRTWSEMEPLDLYSAPPHVVCT